MAERVDHRREMQALAFAQAGYFTANQARKVGFSYQAQKYHADRGNWTRIDRGLFRLPGWPADPNDKYTRWCVWSEGKGVVSHQSAAALHGYCPPRDEVVHLTMPPGSSSRNPQVSVHAHALMPAEIIVRGALKVTTPARTLMDLTETLPPEELIQIMLRAIDMGGVSESELAVACGALKGTRSRKLREAMASVQQGPEASS